MNNLIQLNDVSLSFGGYDLLDQVKLQIASGERVCLIGSNGAGKSSLLKIIDGTLLSDSGDVWRKPNLRIARLQQALPNSFTKTVHEFVTKGLAEAGDLLAAYHFAAQQLSKAPSKSNLNHLEILQKKIEAIGAWHFEQEIKIILEKLELNPEWKVGELSGGWQRRVALAEVLVAKPELLLLDEPTNHLDLDAIQWLEQYLLQANFSLLFITHDRDLLQRLATRIIELDRGQLTSWPGDYQNFLSRKSEMLHAEARQNDDFDKKLAQEEQWIRQGIKARRTRNEGRVRALEKMRLERSQRREKEGKVKFNIKQAEKSGQLVIEANQLFYRCDHQEVIKDFSLRVMRGDRIGLIGPNGIGKTTLLNLLLKKIEPQQGTVVLGTKLEVGYFDQLREELDLEKSVADNVTHGSDSVEINGQKRHIISYLSDFLFTPQRALTPVKALSGGECNRLVLARLFSRPTNMLVMDEPTNDLDIETLELLEEILVGYKGTLLLVSHDRKFLDNVVTSTLVFTGGGKIEEYIGGFRDWQRIIKQKKAPAKPNTEQSFSRKPKEKQKLTFKEQQELALLPNTIEELESQIAEQQQLMASSEFYTQSPKMLADAMANLNDLESKLALAYHRWEALEAKLP